MPTFAQFEPAFAFLMKHEDAGLHGDITVDSGGVTRWGISQKAYPSLDIRNLTLEQAASIYRADYFLPIHGYEIYFQVIASKLLDMAVNMGVKTAIKITQMACCDAGHPTTADGVMGPNTIAAINACDPTTLLDAMRSRSKDHYCQLAAANPSLGKYLNGWLARAEA